MLDWSGSTPPAVLHRPRWLSSVGWDVVELAGSCGLFYDPWQCLALEEMLGRTTVDPWAPGSRWATPEVGVIIARQNGKDALVEGICLASLFLWRESFVHSAHQFKTTKKAFLRLRALILANPDLRKRLRQPIEGKGITTGVGNEGIHLVETADNGDPLEGMYVARSGGSGRGFTVPRVIYNEAWDLDADSIAAQTPAQATLEDPQTIYLTSPPDQVKHPNAKVIGELRERARAGGDPDLCWLEWTADPDGKPGADADATSEDARAAVVARRYDRGAQAAANPSLDIVRPDGTRGVSSVFLARQARSPMGGRGYDVEHLSIGDWPVADETARFAVIPKGPWVARVVPASAGRPEAPVSFGLAGSWPHGETGTIAVVGGWPAGEALPAGGRIAEVVEHRPDEGLGWMVDRAVELAVAHPTCAVVLDPAGPAGHLAPDLHRALDAVRVELILTTAREVAQAAARAHTSVTAFPPRLVHYGQPVLTAAVGAAGKRDLGDGWTWARRGRTDIGPVEAVTLADHGHVARAAEFRAASIYEERGMMTL